jgi:hypothetical protein
MKEATQLLHQGQEIQNTGNIVVVMDDNIPSVQHVTLGHSPCDSTPLFVFGICSWAS